MKRELSALLEEVTASPRDWEIRLAAIEEALRAGDRELARRLVREDPSTEPLAPEIQARLHALMTRGPLEREVTSPDEGEIASARGSNDFDEDSPKRPREERSTGEKSAEEKPRDSLETAEEKPRPASSRRARDLGGGLAALLEDDEAEDLEAEPLAESRSGSAPLSAPNLGRAAVREMRREPDERFVLEEVERYVPEDQSLAGERLSSLTVAIFTHLVLFFLVGLVAVTVPLPDPPQLVVSTVPEPEEERITPLPVKPDMEIKPAAAAARAIDVLHAAGESEFALPELEETSDRAMLALLPGPQPTGNGMSFEIDDPEASDINFFGISGGGDRVVFIIDATPRMLVDEKGGMTAYDNVKSEVGAMLANLSRGTRFNLLLYQDKRLIAFRDELVAALPSNLRMAIEWLAPLNRDYERLGLPSEWGDSLEVSGHEELPLRAEDVAHYTKAVHKAMEWRAGAVFCILSGHEGMRRSLTPEMRKMVEENPPDPGTPGEFDPAEVEAWEKAVAETRAWLEKENAARHERGISPKVVPNFNELVRERTGADPPRRRGGTPPSGGADIPRLPPVTPEDIEEHLEELVELHYGESGQKDPGVNFVLFLGEDEDIGADEDLFRTLARRNHGKIKVLRGLAALEDVTTNR